MSKPAVTYMKREWKKVLPVLVLSVCYAAFVFVLVFLSMSDMNTSFRLMMAYPDGYSSFEIGDMFITSMYDVLSRFHGFAVIVFEAMLILSLIHI